MLGQTAHLSLHGIQGELPKECREEWRVGPLHQGGTMTPESGTPELSPEGLRQYWKPEEDLNFSLLKTHQTYTTQNMKACQIELFQKQNHKKPFNFFYNKNVL